MKVNMSNTLQILKHLRVITCVQNISAALTPLYSPAASPPGPYWVLSSDYEGHSLVYGCTDFGLFRMEFAWILSREPTLSEETTEELQSILSSAGISVNKLVATNQDATYCSAMTQ